MNVSTALIDGLSIPTGAIESFKINKQEYPFVFFQYQQVQLREEHDYTFINHFLAFNTNRCN